MSQNVSFQTVNRIITFAMKDAGLLDKGNEPDGEDFAEGLNRLNDQINYFLTKGQKLFMWEDLPIPLTQGIALYSLGLGGTQVMAKPMRAFQGYYNDTTNAASPTQRPLIPMSWDDFLTLSSRNPTGAGTGNQGPVNSYFVDKQTTVLNIWFWMTPDAPTAANGQAHLLIEQQMTQAMGITDTMYFPQEWYTALRWCLAEDWCTGQPAQIVQRCMQNAMRYRTDLENWDVEDAPVTFQPSYEGRGSRFT